MDAKSVIAEAASRYGIDPKILWGVYGTETSFGKDVSTSSAGAVGPFQFEPATARSMGVNPYDFKSAAFGAARYLSQYKSRGLAGMLSAYNAGPAGGLQQDYVNKTLANARSYGTGVGVIPQAPQAATVQKVPGISQPAETTSPGNPQKLKGLEMLGQLLKSEKGSSENPLLRSGLLAKAEQANEPSTTTTPAPALPAAPSASTPAALPSGSTVAYVNPISGFMKGRTDMGVDASAKPGTVIRALGNAKVLGISPNWYAGQPYVYYELLDGPERGKVVYVAEQIAPTVRPGQTVRRGDVIGRYAPSGTGIETGFGTRTGGRTLAQAQGNTGDSLHNNAPAGVQFRRFLEGLK